MKPWDAATYWAIHARITHLELPPDNHNLEDSEIGDLHQLVWSGP